ncbi:hypothetical protein [Alteraurantiacibacter palmitatis]|uniref:Uncharacterized protein n=1 Tax=Alteraurantiacibacter palmitatis TaxID=2054628 RepID=A0ABV7E3F3_9SPHN
MLNLPAFILFASEATEVGLWAAAFLLLAAIALLADWRRARRRDIDRVGCVPWTPVFLASATIGAGLLLVAIKGWLGG